MRELRAKTNFPHKIIAVACTIDHARSLRALYEGRHELSKEELQRGHNAMDELIDRAAEKVKLSRLS